MATGAAFPLAGIGVVDVQEITAPLAAQPQPLPLAARKVNPGGSVSMRVIAPKVDDVPLLPARIVYVPVEPTAKLPAWVLEIVKTGCRIVVASVAPGVFAAPPPETDAMLVSVAGAFAATFTVRAIALPAAFAAMAVELRHVAL
jgi:hypothetical protein